MFIKKRKGSLFGVLVVAIVAVIYYMWGGTSPAQPQKDYTDINYDNLVVRFMDVGQGDCEIIQLPDGTNIIIDGGPESAQRSLLKEIDSYGIKKFDYVIATHPHEDHIGGLDAVIRKYDIGKVYLPKSSSTSDAFFSMAETIKKKGVPTLRAEAGVIMIDGEDVRAEFLAPVKDKYDDTNNYSAVLKLTYYGFDVLFTGDAEEESERNMMRNGADLDAEVLKVAHHGSSTSSTERFIEKVSPDYAVIEVGEDNSYGHPHREVMERFEGIPVYRTDINGTITLTYGKDGVNITTEK